jgi:hypothetical protein
MKKMLWFLIPSIFLFVAGLAAKQQLILHLGNESSSAQQICEMNCETNVFLTFSLILVAAMLIFLAKTFSTGKKEGNSSSRHYLIPVIWRFRFVGIIIIVVCLFVLLNSCSCIPILR